MGTSSSYGGPTGYNSLLPDWAQSDSSGHEGNGSDSGASDADRAPDGGEDSPGQEGGEDGSEQATADTEAWSSQQPTNFRGAKSSMTRHVRSGGGDGIGRVARNYVGARGGARRSAQAATAGRAATGSLGSFLSAVASRGIKTAAREYGLAGLAGRSAAAVFAEIANRLAPTGATLEEAAARRAVDDALYALYERFDLGTADISTLDAMDASAIRQAVESSVSAYIYHRWLQELGDRIEENAVSAKVAVRLEREVRDYVQHTVHIDLQDVDVLKLDWKGPQGSGIVERIYHEAYGLLES